jgi:polyisoprenoid-binding protein YceI
MLKAKVIPVRRRPSNASAYSLQPLALCVALALAGCSDPSSKVHKSTASDPSTSAPPVETATPPATTSTQPGKPYVIRSDSTIGFTGSKVTGHHNGGFKNFAGTIHVDGGTIVGTPAIQIGMKSTWADNERLTGHLKSADFFDVGKFPVSTFTVKTIEPAGTAQKITGDLNLHGVIKTISFPADVKIAEDAVTVKATFAINRRQFNINYPGKPNDLIRDNVVIKLDLKATPGAVRPEDQLVN